MRGSTPYRGVMTTDQVIEPREVPLGGLRRLLVHRTLPHRDLPTIGAWCFVDHFGPTDEPMAVLPHPHTGLQTVTWPLAGEVRHRDSLGSDVVLKPAQLNLMTSGDGVSHSEFSVGDASGMHGIQLWVALPEGARTVPADFEHLPDLPRVSGDGWSAVVLIGTLDGATSPARVHSPLLGAELRVESSATLSLDPSFEHGLLAVDGSFRLGEGGDTVEHRSLQYLAPGRDAVSIHVDRPTTLMLIGGEPLEDELVMWWNFIGRTHEDIEQARADWEAAAARFGHVDGHDGQVIPAPPLPHTRLTPRRRR